MSAPTTDRPLAVTTIGDIGFELAGRLAGSVRQKARGAAARIFPDRLESEWQPWMDEPGSDDFPG